MRYLVGQPQPRVDHILEAVADILNLRPVGGCPVALLLEALVLVLGGVLAVGFEALPDLERYG